RCVYWCWCMCRRFGCLGQHTLGRRPLGLCGFQLLASAQAFNEGEVTRNDKHTECGGDQHAKEHTSPHHVLCARPGTACFHQWHYTKDERERSHQNRTESKSSRRQRRIFQRQSFFVFCFRELDDQNSVLGRETDPHHQTNLYIDVVVKAKDPDAKERSQGYQRRT